MWLSRFKDAELPISSIRVSQISRLDDWGTTRARIMLTANATAAFVSVLSTAVCGAFDDGGFILMGGTHRSLEFVAKEPFQMDAFKRGLRIRSLRDSYG